MIIRFSPRSPLSAPSRASACSSWPTPASARRSNSPALDRRPARLLPPSSGGGARSSAETTRTTGASLASRASGRRLRARWSTLASTRALARGCSRLRLSGCGRLSFLLLGGGVQEDADVGLDLCLDRTPGARTKSSRRPICEPKRSATGHWRPTTTQQPSRLDGRANISSLRKACSCPTSAAGRRS